MDHEYPGSAGADPLTARMTGRTAHGGLLIDVPFMSEIVPGLWQGGTQQGLVLPEFIRHVVSLYPWESYEVRHRLESSLTVRMYDSLDQSAEQVLLIADWVNSCRRSGPVLVHCQAGLNRSSLITAAALVSSGTDPEAAVRLLREKRSPACLCNPAFGKWVLGLRPGPAS